MIILYYIILLGGFLFITIYMYLNFKCDKCDNCPKCDKCDNCDNCPNNEMCSTFNSIDPQYCIKPIINQDLSTDCSEYLDNDTCKSNEKDQCALELILGNGTHMTMAYICNGNNICKNTNEKTNLIKNVITHIKEVLSPNNDKLVIDIVLGNMLNGFFSKNSRCVLGDLVNIKSVVMSYLIKNKYCITQGVWGGTPHTEVLFNDNDCRIPNTSIDVLDPNNWKIDY